MASPRNLFSALCRTRSVSLSGRLPCSRSLFPFQAWSGHRLLIQWLLWTGAAKSPPSLQDSLLSLPPVSPLLTPLRFLSLTPVSFSFCPPTDNPLFPRRLRSSPPPLAFFSPVADTLLPTTLALSSPADVLFVCPNIQCPLLYCQWAFFLPPPNPLKSSFGILPYSSAINIGKNTAKRRQKDGKRTVKNREAFGRLGTLQNTPNNSAPDMQICCFLR